MKLKLVLYCLEGNEELAQIKLQELDEIVSGMFEVELKSVDYLTWETLQAKKDNNLI